MNIEQKFLLDYVGHCLNNTSNTSIKEFPWDLQYDEIKWGQVKILIGKYGLYNFLWLDNLDDDRYVELKNDKVLRQHMFMEMDRIIKQTHRWGGIKDAFEKAKIEGIALKGIITKDLYPIDILRTMHDIDILYKEQQHSKMEKALNDIGFVCKKKALKHDHFLDELGIHIEMHREMVDVDTNYHKYYSDVWKKAKKLIGYQHVFTLSPEDMYIYTLIHMKEHLIRGEATIKMVIDVYVMRNKERLDYDYISNELERIALQEFEKNVVDLSEKWFKDGCNITSHDRIYELSEFLLGNQTYGVGNIYSAYYAYNVGKNKYSFYLKSAFPSLRRMQTLFVWLKPYPILLPIAWIIRIVRAVSRRREIVSAEVRKAEGINNAAYEQGKKFSKMLSKYGVSSHEKSGQV